MKKLLCTFALLSTLQANAQLIVGFTGGDPLTLGPGTAGFDFTVGSTPLVVQTLGVWDDSGTGLSSSHLVGIWEMLPTPTHNLLASALVTPQAAVDLGGFWYVNITEPLTLKANGHYMIGARYSDNDFDFARGNIASVTMAPGVTIGDAYLSSGVGFEFPDLNVSAANFGFIGPTAGFEAVPEPAAMVCLAAIALVAFAAVRRHLSKILLLLFCLNLEAGKPPITIRDVLDAKTSDRQRVIAAYIAQNPGKAKTIKAAVPPANRPTDTPGNEHGNRPEIPPGLHQYGTP